MAKDIVIISNDRLNIRLLLAGRRIGSIPIPASSSGMIRMMPHI